MGGFFQNRSYYQFTNGFTTRTATNDGTGSALASFLLGLPAVKQRQEGIPQMQLRQWYAYAFVQDSFQLTGQPVFDDNSRNADRWFNTAAFATPGGVHVRQHRPEPCLWTRQTDVGSRAATRVCDDGDGEGASARGSLQRTEPHEPRYAEPFRQHAAVRHDH